MKEFSLHLMRIISLNGRHTFWVLWTLFGKEEHFVCKLTSRMIIQINLQKLSLSRKCSIQIFTVTGTFVWTVILLLKKVLQNNWSPMYDICAVLTSIRSLLSDPNPSSPANQQAAQMFANNVK